MIPLRSRIVLGIVVGSGWLAPSLGLLLTGLPAPTAWAQSSTGGAAEASKATEASKAREIGTAGHYSVQAEANRPAATPQRPSLAALLEPLWIDLSLERQNALAPFAPEWNTWPTAEKKAWVALADKLPGMSTEHRAKAQRRIAEWANLSMAQRRLARENYRLAKERSAKERVSEWQRYQSMTQEQRSVLRQAGTTSNTAAGHAGAANGLAKEAAQPLPRVARPATATATVTDRPATAPATNQPATATAVKRPASGSGLVPTADSPR